jgi:hypothetical protein
MSKHATIPLVTILILSSLVVVESTFAQSITQPSVPEFTLTLVDDSYDVPLTTTVNPYTGKTEISGGYHVKHDLEVHIQLKNQPFKGLFYQVQTKGHFSQDWHAIEYWIGEAGSRYNPRTPYKEQKYAAQYTILKYKDSGNLPREGLIDFRVQALIGHPVVHHTSDHLDLYNMWASFSFNGTASDWSNTQTINLSDGTVTQSPSSSSPNTTPDQTTESPTPTQTEFTIAMGAAGVAAVIVAGVSLLFYFKKRRSGDIQS